MPQRASDADIEVYLPQWIAGEIEPVPVTLKPLPPNAPRAAKPVTDFYVVVRGLRLDVCDEEPVPFGGEWVAGWLSALGWATVTQRTVARTLTWLVDEARILERGEDYRVKATGRLVFTYLPRLRAIDGGAE